MGQSNVARVRASVVRLITFDPTSRAQLARDEIGQQAANISLSRRGAIPLSLLKAQDNS